MKKFPFRLDALETVIVVQAEVQNYEIRLALDTAASQTVIDWNVLLILGYSPNDLRDPVEVETANGILEAWRIKIRNLETLDLHRSDFEVLTYDFFEKGLFSPQDGVLGLDFFKNTILTIDFQKHQVWVSDK